ncbi:unnamed protein product, partial [Penicillium salamii]
MSTNPFKENMICDLGTIKAQSQLPISISTPITCESQMAANTKPNRPRRRSRSKVVTGLPKSLCLPRLCGLENIASVLIVRQESPWDTYRKVITYEVAGKVTIATRRTRPSRMVAIRSYRKENARRLIYRFGRLEHMNVLSLYECYMHEDLAFFLVDDLPLTLAHVVAFPSVYPSETELGSIICQLSCLDLCVDCTPDQSEAAYIAALPSITIRLMQKYDKDQGVVGVNDLERWPIDSA